MQRVSRIFSSINSFFSAHNELGRKIVIACLLLYCFSALLIFPYKVHTYRYGGPFILSLFALYHFIFTRNFDLRDKKNLSGAFLFFVSLFFLDYAMLGTVTLLILLGSIASEKIEKPLFPWIMKLFIWFCFYSIITQLREFQSNGHPVLSVRATNYSGMYLLFYFFLCKKYRFYFGEILCLVASYLISSRNFVYSMLVFYFFDFLRVFFSSKKLFQILKQYVPLLLSFNVVMLVFAYFFVEVLSPSNVPGYDNSTERIFTPYDSAAFERLRIIVFYFKTVFSDWIILFKGFNEGYIDFFHKKNQMPDIHNSLFAVLARYGIIWTAAFFFFLSTNFKKFFTVENIPFLITHIFFGLFLHTLFETQPLLIFGALLMIPRMHFDGWRRPWRYLF